MYLYLSQFVNLSNLYLSHLALLPATVKDSFYTSIQRERFPGVNVLSSQLCPTLCDPLGCSHQAPLSMGFFRQEYWVVISFSRGSFRSSNQTRVSCISCIAGGFFTAEPLARIYLPNRRHKRQGSDREDSPGEGNGSTLHFQAVPLKCHGQRSLVGYSPKAESDTTEQLSTTFKEKLFSFDSTNSILASVLICTRITNFFLF